MRLFGEDITRLGAPQRAQRGIGRAFQLTQLFPNLTVHRERAPRRAEPRARGPAPAVALVEARRAHREGRALPANAWRSPTGAHAPAASLSHGEQRKLEVAILLALEPQVLMFDEPTAGMSMDEVPVVLELIQQIKDAGRPHGAAGRAQAGGRALAGRPHPRAARRRLVADGDPAEVMASPIVREAYLGTGAPDDD